MSRSDELRALAEKVQALTGPCRETDAVIWLAVTPGATRKETVIPPNEKRKGWTIDETREASGRLINVPAFTAGLDAAMTLVPEGAFWRMGNDGEGPDPADYFAEILAGSNLSRFRAVAATPALALTAAALLARTPRKERRMTTTETTAPDAALLPCAHCGSADVEIRTSLTDELIACNNCGARTGLIWLCDSEAVNAKRRRQLVAAWNRRAGQSHAGAGLLAALEQAIVLVPMGNPEWTERAAAAIAAAKGASHGR